MKTNSFHKKLIKYCTTIFFSIIILNSFSIGNIKTSNESNSNNNTQWQLYAEKDGIAIYFKTKELHIESDGIHQEYYLLKFVNTSDKDLKINWKLDIWYNDVCRTCKLASPNEYELYLTLKKGESIEGNLSTPGKELKIFSSNLNTKNSSLTKFELNNIVVTKL